VRTVRLVAAAVTAVAAIAAAATAAPPPVTAESYVVVGDVDGAVLAQRNSAEPRAIASITKLMTVLITLDHARPDEIVTVSPVAAGVGESSVFLRAGEHISVRDLVVATLVPSANDAATALALYVGGGSLERFVALMNEKASELGLRDTNFENPHGLDQPGHVSSARDTVRLLRAALEVPLVRTLATTRSATIAGGRRVDSTDDLLGRFAGFEGGKTGQTSEAGWSQVAAAHRGQVRVFVSVLGAPSEGDRNRDLEALLLWGLDRYRLVEAVDDERAYASAGVGYGRPGVDLVAPAAVVRPARVDRPLVERVVFRSAVALPVRAGQRLGEVRVLDGRRLVARSPLVAARTVAEPGALSKVRWYATRTVQHLVGFVT
jgi:serine-type D-Ala-D-Ala carboxypeptidase (penicillin-binding protein 5/6)